MIGQGLVLVFVCLWGGFFCCYSAFLFVVPDLSFRQATAQFNDCHCRNDARSFFQKKLGLVGLMDLKYEKVDNLMTLHV